MSFFLIHKIDKKILSCLYKTFDNYILTIISNANVLFNFGKKEYVIKDENIEYKVLPLFFFRDVRAHIFKINMHNL